MTIYHKWLYYSTYTHGIKITILKRVDWCIFFCITFFVRGRVMIFYVVDVLIIREGHFLFCSLLLN
jgi:hypothetical protein